jgi:PIN domain nuclease of toxin-antitoxin system
MALMLDTCGLLSLVGLAEKRLSPDTLSSIEIADTVYISSCSLFEIAIKHKKRGLDLGVFSGAKALWDKALPEYEIAELPVTGDAFFQSVALPDLHADPFDRIIIAQAKALQLHLISFDKMFVNYGIAVMA